MTAGRKPDLVARAMEPTAASHGSGDLSHLEPPEGMTDEELDLWHLVVPGLLSSRVLRESDLPTLVQYLRAMAIADRAYETLLQRTAKLDELEAADTSGFDTKELDRHEVRISRTSGLAKRARTEWVQATTLALRIGSELGIGPVSRARLGLGAAHGSFLETLNRAAEATSGT